MHFTHPLRLAPSVQITAQYTRRVCNVCAYGMAVMHLWQHTLRHTERSQTQISPSFLLEILLWRTIIFPSFFFLFRLLCASLLLFLSLSGYILVHFGWQSSSICSPATSPSLLLAAVDPLSFSKNPLNA